MRYLRFIGSLIYALSLGCGGGSATSGSSKPADATSDAGSSASSQHICDGSPGIRFAYEAGGGAPVGDGEIVMTENGFSVAVILGNCDYWVYGADWEGVKTGHLADSRSMETALQIDAWPNWYGKWHSGLCDGPGSVFKLGSQTIDVEGGCVPRDAPFDIDALQRAWATQLAALKAAAVETTGGVRFVLYAYNPSDPAEYPDASWPLETDPASLAISIDVARSLQAGQSNLLSDSSDAAKLRALRDTFLSGAYGGLWYGNQLSVVGANGARYGLWFRDVMPGEDANGLVHLF